MYLRASKTEAEEAGLATDGMASSVAKLREELLSLTGGKLDIQIDENNFKSSFQILKELSEIWDEIGEKAGDVSQANILNLLGGKRNANVLASIITNFKDAVDASETAANSMGSAWTENEKYLNSIEGKTKQLQAAFETFATSIINSDIVKTIVGAGKGILEFANGLQKVGALVPSIAVLVTLIKTMRDSMIATTAANQIVGAGSTADAISSSIAGLAKYTAAQKSLIALNVTNLGGDAFKKVADAAALGGKNVLTFSGAMGTAKTVVASFGTTIKTMLTSWTTWVGIIMLVVSAVRSLIQGAEEARQAAIKAAKEQKEAYEEAYSTCEKNISSLEKLRSEYDRLSQGVDKNGHNVSLTASEYEKYLSIVDQIVEISPTVADGYDKEGAQLETYTGLIDRAIEKQRELLDLQKNSYLSKGETLFTGWNDGMKETNKAYAEILDDLNKTLGGTDYWQGRNMDNAMGKFTAFTEVIHKFGITYADAINEIDPAGGDTWSTNYDFAMQLYDAWKNNHLIDALQMTGKFTQEEIEQLDDTIRSFSKVIPTFKEARAEVAEYLQAGYDQWLPTKDLAEQLESVEFAEKQAIKIFESGIEDISDPNATMAENKAALKEYMEYFVQSAKDFKAVEQDFMNRDIEAGEWFNDGMFAKLVDQYARFPAIVRYLSVARSELISTDEEIVSTTTDVSKLFDLIGKMSTLEKFVGGANAGKSFQELASSAKEFIDLYNSITGNEIDASDLFYGDEWMTGNIDKYIKEMVNAVTANNKFAESNPELVASLLSLASTLGTVTGATASFTDAMNAVNTVSKLKSAIDDLVKAGENATDADKASIIETLNEIIEKWNEIRKAEAEANGDFYVPLTVEDVLGEDLENWDLAKQKADEFKQAIITTFAFSEGAGQSKLIRWLLGIDTSAKSATNSTYELKDAMSSLSDVASILEDGFDQDDMLGSIEKAKKLADEWNSALAALGKEGNHRWTEFVDFDMQVTGDSKAEDFAKYFIPEWYDGNADITNRKIIPVTIGVDVDEDSPGYATFLSTEYGAHDASLDRDVVLHVQTIDNDGNRWTGEEVDSYINYLQAKSEELGKTLQEVDAESDRMILHVEVIEDGETFEDAKNRVLEWHDQLMVLQNAWDEFRFENNWFGDESIDASGAYAQAMADLDALIGGVEDKNTQLRRAYEDIVDAFLAGQTEMDDGLKALYKSSFMSWVDKVLNAKKLEEEAKKVQSAAEQISDAFDYMKEHVSGDVFTGSLSESLEQFYAIKDKFGDAAKAWNWSDFFDYDIDTGELRNKTGVLADALHERAREVANALTQSMIEAGQIDEADGAVVSQRIVQALTTAKGQIESAYEDLTNTISKVKTAKSFNEAVLGYQSGDTDFLSMLEASINTAEELGIKLEDVFDFATMQPSAVAVERAIESAVDELIKGKGYSEEFADQLKAAAKAARETQSRLSALETKRGNITNVMSSHGSFVGGAELTYDNYKSLMEISEKYADTIEYINGRLTVNAQKFDEVSIAIAKETSETAKLQIQQNNLKIQELIKQYKNLSDVKKKQEIANEIRRLQDESAGFALLASEIDNATDAFARFNSANGSAKSDRYSSALEAFGIINDVLNNKNSELFGQKGNLKFRAALDLDINPNFSFEESYAQVERYFKEDDGLWNFADDLREKFADASGNINTTVADIASELKISEDAVRALLEQLNKYNDPENQIQIDGDGSAAEQAKTIQEEIAEVMEGANKASESIDNLNKKEVSTSTAPAQEETKTLSESLTEVSDKVDKINAKSISILMSGTQSATEKLNGSLASMLKTLQQLAEMKINIPIKLTTGTTNTPEGGSSTGTTFWDRLKSWAGFSSAKGTSGKGFFGGESLVGELGREIVVDVNNGRWYTVGDNGPEIANIPKGSIIINNAETEKILKNRGKSGGSSNANGTFTWKGLAQSIADFVDKTGKTIGNIPTRPTGNGKGSKAPSIEDELKRIKEAFEKVNAEYEHYIKHQEQSYYLSERATDYDSMRIALLNQAEYYQTIYDEAMKAIEEMKKAGADDTNEELQSVEETAWGAYQSMMGIYDQVRDLLKGALNEEVDAIQSAFGNLKTAVEQYNETGHITIDTLQSLLDGGLQYLQFLTNEDGQLSINTESLRELLQARKEQLAIETALSNISRIREAAEKGETETVNALIDATQDLGSSTWDLAKAQAAELLSSQLISQEQYDKLIQNIEAARQLAAMAEDDLSMGEVDAIGQIKEKYEELNEQVDHYIKHLEQAQKVAQRYSNYNDNEGSIRAQIAEYQRIIEDCNQAIAEMEAEGADDTTKELQEMEEAAWSARQSIWSLYDQLYSLRTDAIAARIDNIQSSISDFQKAMEEMSDTGMVTLDTFQSIVSNGMQYLQYLNIENGQLSVNQEAVEQMIRAKKEQLAVETAMSYLNQIEEALLAGEAQKVAELVSLTEDLSESTWAAVYAKLALLKTEGLSDEDAAQVESYIEKLRDLSDLVDTNIAAPVVETVEDRLASILDAFNEVKEDLEHYIAHQEQKFTEDERALDFGGMTAALQNEIGYYQQIYNKAQETIGELMANGADDTTKELQEVEEAAWSAYNSMNEAFDKINALRVDELNEELNRLKSTYNNLKGAIEEFNEHGKISLDSFEQLLSGGIQYLTFLQKEDGQYKMTEQSLKDYISARKEQLALETAMSYLANIRQALENGEVQRVNSLIDASNELSASTWDLVAAKAAELRVMGLTDDQYNLLLANLEKLKDLTRNVETDLGAWDAETTDPIEEMEEAFNNLNKEIEHYIAHQEQAYKLNERAWDFRGMEQALNNEVGYYKRIMEEAQSTIDQMKAAGADDTNESLQAVEESMWSAQNSMFDAIDKLRSLRVDALKEELDALTNSFDDLKTAADEYNKTGAMSLSTFESILENGVQYLSLLDEEGGKYVIAKDRLQDYIQTRKEQLAIETAVSYLSEIREAMENGEEERLRKLIDATNGLSSSTWAMVDAQLAALNASGMSSEQYETVVSNVEKLRALANQVNTDLVDGGEDVTDEYEKQQDALNKILKFTEDLIRAEAKDQVDAIKKQIEEYKEIIRLKKESLQQTKEETEYQDEVADKVKEIAQLQSKADLLALDTSRTANAERQKLLQEIQNKQDELSKYQGDHAYDAQMEALDKEAEAYEESRQAEIEAIEKSVSSEEKVYQLAIARIRDQWDTLYADLINWNTEQGSVINQEITDAWNEALKAVQAYGGYVESLAGLEAAISGKNSNGNLVVADIPKYHGGGVTGEKGKLNDDEVLAILQKGELVVDKEQKRGLYTVVDFVKSLGERLGTKIGNLRNMNIAGTMMPAFAGMTAPGSAGMVETSNISFNNTFDVHIDGGVGDQAAARQFGNTIAETAANSLFDAFNRRGINIIQTLRQ